MVRIKWHLHAKKVENRVYSDRHKESHIQSKQIS